MAAELAGLSDRKTIKRRFAWNKIAGGNLFWRTILQERLSFPDIKIHSEEGNLTLFLHVTFL